MNTDKFIYNLSKTFVYFSCINFALYTLNPDYSILHLIVKDPNSIRYFYILVGLLAVYLLLHDKLNKQILSADHNNNSINSLLDKDSTLLTYNINAPDADQIVWWVTDELKQDKYHNSGVSNVNNGIAKLVIPIVNTNQKNNLLRFREMQGGLLGDVKTIFLN